MPLPVPPPTEADLAYMKEQGWAEKLEDFTCHDCPHKATCEYAWDPYNTGGDCLASK